MKTILLTEYDCIGAIKAYLRECDSDELARLVGELFGGTCFPNCKSGSFTTIYEFTPDLFYCGCFDCLKQEETDENKNI